MTRTAIPPVSSTTGTSATAAPSQKTNLPKVTHTFPAQAGWHDVKLMVSKGDGTKTTTNVGNYRQVEPINFAPTYYPATPPAGEPSLPPPVPPRTRAGS